MVSMTSRALGVIALLLVPASPDRAASNKRLPTLKTQVAYGAIHQAPKKIPDPSRGGARSAPGDGGFAQGTRPLKFVVISDIHVLQPKNLPPVPKAMHGLIRQIVRLRPGFVAITGDFTNGGKRDRFGSRGVERWWSNVHKILQPLRAAGIPVLPLPGNHDLAREKHVLAYKKAWADLNKWASPLVPKGKPPMYYSVNIDGVHLSLMDFARKETPPRMFKWLQADLAAAGKARMRLAFGHLPLRSTISRRRGLKGVFKKLADVLVGGGVTAYFAGHEHVIWDEMVSPDADGKRSVRQVTCGVAGAPYRYGLSARLFTKHCKKNRWCVWPNNGRHFRVTRKHRRLPDPISFIVGEVRGRKLTIVPHVLKSGRMVPYPTSPQIIRPPLPAGTRRVLILGDSHMKGTFGYMIHKAMHLRGKYDILSLGVGGAGTREFTMKVIRDWCCGYKVRRSWPMDPSGKTFHHELVESSQKKSRRVIGEEWGGSLAEVLKRFKPEVLLLILGGNVTNLHDKLLTMLKTNASDAALVWVGPFKRKWYKSRYKEITRALKKAKWGHLVHSDDVLGNEELLTAHFGRQQAWLWANTAAERMAPFLVNHFKAKK